MRPDPARRSTRFGRWLDRYGVDALRRDLHAHGLPLLTPNAVRHWQAGRALPRIEAAAVIVKLSRGRVRPADLLEHAAAMRRARVEAATARRYSPAS